MVSLRQAFGARDLSRSNHPGRDMGRTFLEGRIVRGSETQPIHCVEEKKVSLLGHKKADGIRQRARKASRPNCLTPWTIARSRDSNFTACFTYYAVNFVDFALAAFL